MWFKVDDGFHSHVKRHKAGLEAVGAWTIAGSWSGQNLTEGYIPPEICATIAPPRVWTKLRAAGLTEAPAGGGAGEQLHDFLVYNPSTERVKANRVAGKARIERFRHGNAVTPPAGNAVTPPAGNAVGNGAPDPTRPDPTRDPPLVPPPGGERATEATSGTPPAAREQGKLFGDESKAGGRRKRAVALPAGWAPPEALFAFGAELGLEGSVVEREIEAFRDHHTAKGSVMNDWNAAARTWIRNVPKFAGRGAHASPLPGNDPPDPAPFVPRHDPRNQPSPIKELFNKS